MVGVKLLVFVVLGCVLSLLPVRVVDGVTLQSGAVQSKLSESFFVEQDTVFVRFAQLYFNRSREEYTRYVPSRAQRKSKALAWVAVTGTNIKKFTECASYAEQQSAMMFKYEGTKCSLSNVRLSTSYRRCRRRSRRPFFVRTCEEPKVTSVTFVSEPEGLLVSWRVQDRCSISKKYKVSWSNGSFVTSNNSVLSHRISGLPSGHTESVTVVALRSAGTAYGKGKTTSGTTGTTGTLDPTLTKGVVVPTVGGFTVSWTTDDPSNKISDYVISWGNNGRSHTVNKDERTYTISDNLCVDTSFTITARDISSVAFTSTITSHGTPTLPSPVVTNVVITSSGIGVIDVTWNLSDTPSLATNQLVAYSSGGTEIISYIVSGTATTDSFTTCSCSNLTVSITPRDASGNNLACPSASSFTAQHSDCTSGFVDVCSGCLAIDERRTSRSAAATGCSGLNSQAKLVTVSSAAQFAGLRMCMQDNYPELYNPYFWVDLEASGGGWRWRGGYEQTTAQGNVDWANGHPKDGSYCAFINGYSSYKLTVAECAKKFGLACYY